MGMKMNGAFLSTYNGLDKICCQKFGVVTGGTTEYINRLMNARFAPGRDDVLPRLVKYRNIRNRIAHEAGALDRLDGITRADLRWISGFTRDLEKKRDPLSLYLKKARRYARHRRARKYIIWALLILLLVAVGAVALILLL